MKKTLEILGPLEVLRVPAKAKASKTIVLFHGYGASAYDLAGISKSHPEGENYEWIFPNAPLSVDLGYGMEGRAWFPIDASFFMSPITRESFKSFLESRLKGIEALRGVLLEFVKALPKNEIVLGGFSQGAMLSTDLALRSQNKPKALIIFSGSLVDPEGWKPFLNESKWTYFQSHGIEDPILPYFSAEDLHLYLERGGVQGEFHPFHGAHEIPLPILQKFFQFLKNLQ